MGTRHSKTAELALSLADESGEVMASRVRAMARNKALSTLLEERCYPEGAALARLLGYPESAIFDLVSKTSEIHDDDPYLAFEVAFGLDAKLLE